VEGSYKGRTSHITKILGGCWSMLGMGRQLGGLRRRINLAKGCWERATLLHELGHAFGLIHEHQRADRDDFLELHAENIQNGFLGMQHKVNFSRERMAKQTPYDFLSIMHYPRNAFSKNGKDTLTPLPGYERFGGIMGTVDRYSKSDAQVLATVYGKPERKKKRALAVPEFLAPLGSR
jgi:hypothetical protein